MTGNESNGLIRIGPVRSGPVGYSLLTPQMREQTDRHGGDQEVSLEMVCCGPLPTRHCTEPVAWNPHNQPLPAQIYNYLAISLFLGWIGRRFFRCPLIRLTVSSYESNFSVSYSLLHSALPSSLSLYLIVGVGFPIVLDLRNVSI